VDSIHDRLRSLAEDARKGIIPMEQFIVTKGLNKLPKDYPDIKCQAHLQVALRMVEQGRTVNVGDHIPYVMCVQGEEGATAPQRARHPDEVKRSQGEYTLDIEWYLGSQILPPVSRLCEPIEGTSQQQLAQCLGLDDSKYVSRSANDDLDFESWGFTPKSRLEDSERFKECVKLTCKCRKCQDDVEFIGCFNSDGLSGLSCPKCNAKYYGRDDAVSSYAHISNRVTLLVNKMVQRYYDCWLKCDDATCGERTRQQSVMGYACKNDCHGRMVAEFNEDMLYTQLKYLETLFDFDRACKKRGIKENELIIKPEDKEVLSLLRKHLSNAVQNSSYDWIRPSLWTVCFGGAAFENLKERRMNQNNNNNGITVAVA
jgi:DNA polymerase alpha subunit A